MLALDAGSFADLRVPIRSVTGSVATTGDPDYASVPATPRDASGIGNNVIRWSIGFEDAGELIARLDHALELYHHGIAPLIITLGGAGGDAYSEGSVGREYLMSKGVPEQDIIAETESRNTEESARRVAVIARANGLRRLVIVSDGTHLFRIHAVCAADDLNVLTSPRPRPLVEDSTLEAERIAHEILSYTFWRLGLH